MGIVCVLISAQISYPVASANIGGNTLLNKIDEPSIFQRVVGSLVPRPFPFLRALGTRETRARGKIRKTGKAWDH